MNIAVSFIASVLLLGLFVLIAIYLGLLSALIVTALTCTAIVLGGMGVVVGVLHVIFGSARDRATDDDPEQTRFDTLEWCGDRWVDVMRPMWCDTVDGHIDDEQCVGRVGKKRAGRRLDGKEHNAFPNPRPPSPEAIGMSDTSRSLRKGERAVAGTGGAT